MSSDPSLHRQQDPSEINALVDALSDAAQNHKPKKSRTDFACKRTSFDVEGTDHKVLSWKFTEQDYKKRDLPTFARGLFTWKDPVSGNNRIAVRGYDKFFNIQEIQRTKWDWIEENTKGPYELTVKENGCIIFISGLPDGTLLVCSKHSIGARGDASASHAKVGEKWVEKQLAAKGKSVKDLAMALYQSNATAVAELCDDSFEEHILEYEGDRAGLYLHGVNLNLPVFATYPMTEVEKFANEWGFQKIDYFLKDDVKSLRKFLEEAAETGSWDGKDVEGFVIRCAARFGPNDPEWHDWFFKYKFDEPYLLYRQWRECTKSLIAGREPKYKKHKEITKEYLKFATAYFKENPDAQEAYQQNHGIIKLRNAFLAQTGIKGSDIIKEAEEEEALVADKLVLVPIATLGCGKTTVAHALTRLFDWGHRQNDNYTMTKGKAQLFAAACSKLLNEKPVVFADRNNHQRRERDQLMKDISKNVPDARFVALHYVHVRGDEKDQELQNRITEITRERVFNRGDNHQNIQAATYERSKVIGIMEGFMNRFQPIDLDCAPDNGFDLVIDLDPTASSRQNLETIVTELHQRYPKIITKLPKPKELDNAMKTAIEDYKPDIVNSVRVGPNLQKKKEDVTQPGKGSKGGKGAIYFAINLPAEQIRSAVDAAFAEATQDKQSFYKTLAAGAKGIIQPEFHVTLIHRSSKPTHRSLWEKYMNTDLEAYGDVEVVLKRVCWDGKVLAIEVTVDERLECANPVPHITVGLAHGVRPKEANDMLQHKTKKWQMVEFPGDGVKVQGRLAVVDQKKWFSLS